MSLYHPAHIKRGIFRVCYERNRPIRCLWQREIVFRHNARNARRLCEFSKFKINKKHTCRRLLDSAAFDLHAGHFYTFVTIHKALIYRFYDDSTCMLMMPSIDFWNWEKKRQKFSVAPIQRTHFHIPQIQFYATYYSDGQWRHRKWNTKEYLLPSLWRCKISCISWPPLVSTSNLLVIG